MIRDGLSSKEVLINQIMWSLFLLLAILSMSLTTTNSFGQVVYQSKCPDGICKSTIVIRTDAETGWVDKKEVTEDKDVEATSCVEYNDGECAPSEYFKVTITDVKD